MKVFASSFRDPSGRVFADGDRIVRSVNENYYGHWRHALQSGFLDECVAKGLLPAFSPTAPPAPEAKAGIGVAKIPFISYPYEWSFAQLKAAALLTLDLHLLALEKGMILKDASAYNVQFVGASPIFIDLLSFERYRDGDAWQAYRQFCMHFLAPLALAKYVGSWTGSLSKLRTDGIPLAQAAALLPWKARFSSGLALHLFAHAAMEKRHRDARGSVEKVKSAKMSVKGLRNFALSLRHLVSGFAPEKRKTQWGDYYADTNYSETAFANKKETVERIARRIGDGTGLAIDLGANTGEFSRLLEPYFGYVLAPDVDPSAVQTHYMALSRRDCRKALPLIIDLSNPSPSLGWACGERDSFPSRCVDVGFIMALALIHHLVLTEGIPFREIAAFIHAMLKGGGALLLEFVPPDDSQVRRLTAAKSELLDGYSMPAAREGFAAYFHEEEHIPLAGTSRSLLLFKRKDRL
jgi:ribosomal protein L11 methylase PrmA